VYRGGDFNCSASECRSASRGGVKPVLRHHRNGFRVARGFSSQIKNQVGAGVTGTSLVNESGKSQDTLGAARSSSPRTKGPKPRSNVTNATAAQNPRGDWTSSSTGMAFVRIKGGEFSMGSPGADKDAFSTERPDHAVRISPFSLGVTEVTQAQYEAVTGNNPSHFAPTGCGRDKVAGQSTAQHPVENVSWLDAIRFCNALSKKDGLAHYYRVDGEKVEIPDRKGPGYRLPTEAEWEYSCRAGKTTRFSVGNDASVLGESGWFGGNSGGRAYPVGQKRRNDFGLYDMHGNVWEWCSDGWDADYYKTTPDDDPPGAFGAASRVFRGGGWDSEPLKSRGLTRSGAYFVVASESEILERAGKIRPPISQMAKAFEQYALVLQNEMQIAETEAFRSLRSEQVDAANKDLSTMLNGARANSLQNEQYQVARAFREGLERERDGAARAVELLRSQQVPPARKEELGKDFAAKRSDFTKADNELKPIYDKAMAEYRKLQADPTVKEALDSFRSSTKAAAYLGPSKNFQAGIDAIKRAERAYAPEIAAPKKKTRPSKR
jgi:formylglycine-generating enzyme required for sulfatase activity